MVRKLQIFSALAIICAMAGTQLSAETVQRRTDSSLQRAPQQLDIRPSDRVANPTYPIINAKKRIKTDNISTAHTRAPRLNKALKIGEANDLPLMYGTVIYASNWSSNDAPAGIYQLQTSPDNDFEQIFTGPNGYAFVEQDGIGYSTNYYSFQGTITVECYDMETGEFVSAYYPDDRCAMAIDLTTDPTTGEVYGITYTADGSAMQLALLEYTTEEVVVIPIATLGAHWNSIACDKDGQLYGISCYGEVYSGEFIVTGSILNKIDKITGAVTKIGETGMEPQYMTSSEIDPVSNRMFWTVSPIDDTGYLTEVNLATGEATPIVQFNNDEEVTGLFFPVPKAQPKAPAVATNLVADFREGSLTGTIGFTAPTTLFNGAPAEGSLSYEILADEDVVARGNTNFGDDVLESVTLYYPANYTFAVVTSNDAGPSPKAILKTFVGNGVPMAPEVFLSYSDGRMNLSWTPVTDSADGGYINPDEVTYSVIRYPDGMGVAVDIKETSFSEEIGKTDGIAMYYYEVLAKYADTYSTAAKSNTVIVGYFELPYEQTFDNAAALDGYTIIDANNDGQSWEINEGEADMTYNKTVDMDDWLITPPLMLEGGKKYSLSFDSHGLGLNFSERFEVKLGMENNAAAMTTTLIEPTAAPANIPKRYNALIEPQTSGIYYVGFHGISEKDQYYLFIDNVSITSTEVPAEVADFEVVPNPDYELSAAVKLTVPTLTATGAPLNAITKIEITRNGEIIKTFDNPKAGEPLGFDDELAAKGYYTYSAAAYNANGKGNPVSVQVFVGLNAPSAPKAVSIVETSNVGEVTVSWEPVTTDIDGKPLDPSRITYFVAANTDLGWTPISENITETSYTFRASDGTEQVFVQYAVFAHTDGGNKGSLTPAIPVGPAYKGLYESFANASLSHVMTIENSLGDPEWGCYTDDIMEGIVAQDGDNGYFGVKFEYLEDRGSAYTGKVSLEGMANPTLTFYTFNIIGSDGTVDDNIIEVDVREMGNMAFNPVLSGTVDALCGSKAGWGKICIDLSAYRNKTIQVRFTCECAVFIYVMMDNIKIDDSLDYDLKATTISAPATVPAGAKYNVDVTIVNNGNLDSSPYTVDLVADGVVTDTKAMDALPAGAYGQAVFECAMHTLATESIELYAVVNYAGDGNLANNTSRTIVVEPKVSRLPSPSELTAVLTGNRDVLLTWTEPNLDGASEIVTESFEDAEPFAQSVEDWTFVDVDGQPIGGFDMTEIPGLVTGESTASFFVFDHQTLFPSNITFDAHTGNKYLASMFLYDCSQADDWAISPELDGSAQTISFYAKSYADDYPEELQILYSTGSLDPSDFIALGEPETVPAEWTLYEAELPEGARNFAIRSCAANAYMFMVDDVTFTIPNPNANLSLLGYNVYCNGAKVNESIVPTATFTHPDGAEGYKYQVTAVYDNKGESGGSNVANVVNGIETVATTITITAGNGCVIVDCAEGLHVIVSSVDGKVLHNANGAAHVPVAPGIYVVKAGPRHTKVIVP